MIGVYEHSRTRACGGFFFGLFSLPDKLFRASTFSFATFSAIQGLFQRFHDSPHCSHRACYSRVFLALTQGVDALHRLIWHDMALADDTQPISTIGRR
jgi:hypothetical protein